MRQKRAKTYRKALQLYMRHFGYRLPLQLLIDAPMALSLAKLKLKAEDVPVRLADVLQVRAAAPLGSKKAHRSEGAEVKCMITQCSIAQLYKAQKDGEVEKEAVALAKSWERRMCNHREAIEAAECIRSVMGPTNKHRYVLASNSQPLRNWVRAEVPGVPIVHSNPRGILVLEPMSEPTRLRIQGLEAAKLASEPSEAAALGLTNAEASSSSNIIGGEALPASSTSVVPTPHRKAPKAPNPLSVKKKKKPAAPAPATGEKRKRDAEGSEKKNGKMQIDAPQGEKKKRVRRKRGAGGEAPAEQKEESAVTAA